MGLCLCKRWGVKFGEIIFNYFTANTSYSTLNMELEGLLTLPLLSVSDTRRSPRSDAEKLDMVCNYMRKELRWGVSDFTKVLAFSGGPANAY